MLVNKGQSNSWLQHVITDVHLRCWWRSTVLDSTDAGSLTEVFWQSLCEAGWWRSINGGRSSAPARQTCNIIAESISRAPASPNSSTHSRISGGMAKFPTPLPATDKPLASVRLLSKYCPTVTILGEYASAEPTPAINITCIDCQQLLMLNLTFFMPIYFCPKCHRLRKRSCLCLLNLSAVFHNTDHNMLTTRLWSWFGIHGSVLNWFKFYLSTHSFNVKCDNSLIVTAVYMVSLTFCFHFSIIPNVYYAITFHCFTCLFNNNLYADDKQFFCSTWSWFKLHSSSPSGPSTTHLLLDVCKSFNSQKLKNLIFFMTSNNNWPKYIPCPLTNNHYSHDLGFSTNTLISLNKYLSNACYSDIHELPACFASLSHLHHLLIRSLQTWLL